MRSLAVAARSSARTHARENTSVNPFPYLRGSKATHSSIIPWHMCVEHQRSETRAVPPAAGLGGQSAMSPPWRVSTKVAVACTHGTVTDSDFIPAERLDTRSQKSPSEKAPITKKKSVRRDNAVGPGSSVAAVVHRNSQHCPSALFTARFVTCLSRCLRRAPPPFSIPAGVVSHVGGGKGRE
ncbi:hypothetical protein X777_08987 [Ooceraea biroi]|uniref:Uncharacterized protein n=1 Tax=Ooceraea biroi TaxID=2015173 RepID=A0A026W880_OOCBI|nr:hypothetical protein X777_08987 [Ooceraea biroi]